MTRNGLRRSFEREITGFMESLLETADEAFEQALANVTPAHACAGIHLHQVQWHNGEPVAVRLYVERNAGEGTSVDG